MNNKKIISVLLMVYFLVMAVAPVSSEVFHGKEWKIGKVTKVMVDSIRVDGRDYYVSESVIIKDINKEILPWDLRVLRGVDEILYRIVDGEIVEIRIYKRRH